MLEAGNVFIRGLGFSVGEQRSLNDAGIEESDVVRLKNDGFQNYYVSKYNIVEMASQSLKKSMKECGISADLIDAVIFTTGSYWEMTGSRRVLDCISQVGLVNAQPFGNGLSACANSMSSLKLAYSLLKSGEFRNAAVVSVDRVAPEANRIMIGGLGVYSDIAASFLVTGAGGIQVIRVIPYLSSSLSEDLQPNDALARTSRLIVELKKFKFKIESEVGAFNYYAFFIIDNLISDFTDLICQIFSIEEEKAKSSKALYGHAFSADWLLSLHSLEDRAEITQGTRFGIINISRNVYYFVDLLYVGSP